MYFYHDCRLQGSFARNQIRAGGGGGGKNLFTEKEVGRKTVMMSAVGQVKYCILYESNDDYARFPPSRCQWQSCASDSAPTLRLASPQRKPRQGTHAQCALMRNARFLFGARLVPCGACVVKGDRAIEHWNLPRRNGRQTSQDPKRIRSIKIQYTSCVAKNVKSWPENQGKVSHTLMYSKKNSSRAPVKRSFLVPLSLFVSK